MVNVFQDDKSRKMIPVSTILLPKHPLTVKSFVFDGIVSLNPQKKFTLLCER